MDIFSVLSYINKISLFAFFVTTLVVVYQVYVLKKEKSKEKAPIIPDFKENSNSKEVINFTSLPSSLTKHDEKAVNYSKLIFGAISLLTIIVIFFIITLIKKNSSSLPEPTVTKQFVSPTIVITPSIAPTVALLPTSSIKIITPTIVKLPTITSAQQLPTPTEIILVQQTITNTTTPPQVTTPQSLPVTGTWEKSLLIIGVSISTIFFAFWL